MTSEVGAINAVANWGDNTNTTATVTLTAAQLIDADLRQSGQTVATTVTTPAAADIVAAMGPGNSFDFVLINNNTTSGAVTVAAGTGVTLEGTTSVPVAASRAYKGVVTNFAVGSEAVKLIGLGQFSAV
jgi:hypothetical protein